MNERFYVGFFLGLLEGDGSIQVNSWKKKYLQFRIIIKLKETPENYRMCVELRDTLGIMNLHIRRGYVILVEDHKKRFPKIMQIIDRYGLITIRKKKQYAFFRYCFDANVRMSEYFWIKQHFEDWFSSFLKRGEVRVRTGNYAKFKPKFILKKQEDSLFPLKCGSDFDSSSVTKKIVPFLHFTKCVVENVPNSKARSNSIEVAAEHPISQILDLEQFADWLCGFVEAEGCFCIRKNGQHSFSIAQKDERDLILAIRLFFQIPNKIQEKSHGMFVIETYNRETLQRILHFLEGASLDFPGRKLLGSKAQQCCLFSQSFSSSFQ